MIMNQKFQPKEKDLHRCLNIISDRKQLLHQ